MAGEQVLVVDNSVQNVDFVVDKVLKPHGYQTFVAQDGEIGLQMALERHPDLILLDITMPKMTGPEMLEALIGHNVKIPAIIMA